MQSLVYILIAVAGLGVGAAAYFGLTFTPIEALTIAILFVAIAMQVLERSLRRRAEARLERAIAEISGLLTNYAQAGAALGQRVSALAEENGGQRLAALEADVSVLGTVVRQVAETMADVDDARKRQARAEAAATAQPAPAQPAPEPPAPAAVQPVAVAEIAPPAAVVEPEPPVEPTPEPTPAAVIEDPVMPLELVKRAIDENRLVFHVQPIVTLPQRRLHGHDLVPRLELKDGTFVDPPGFMPRSGGDTVIRRISWLALEEAITLARRASTDGQRLMLYVPIGRALLAEGPLVERLLALLDANRAITESLALAVNAAEWKALTLVERAAMGAFMGKGVGLSLTDVQTLRLDFAALAGDGVGSVRVDANRFIETPESFSDIHSSDVASFVKRFEVDLIATGIHTEDQLLTLLEDGVAFATGPHIADPAPIGAELVARRPVGRKTPDRAQA